MKKSEKLRVLGAIDEKYIEEAEKEIRFGANKNLWIRVGAIAACFVFILGAAIVPFLTGGAEEIGREIKNEADCSKTWEDIGTMEQDSGMPWVWNKEEGIFERLVIQVAKYDNVPEIAPSNQGVDTVIVGGSPAAKRMIWYPIFMDDYQNYFWADRSVRAEYLGAQIGTVPLTLIDVADGKGITDEALIHEIEGIHHYYAIAVRPEQQYLENSNLTGSMIFYRRDVQFDTFADMIDAYALDEQMYVGTGFVKATKTEDGWVAILPCSSARAEQVLLPLILIPPVRILLLFLTQYLNICPRPTARRMILFSFSFLLSTTTSSLVESVSVELSVALSSRDRASLSATTTATANPAPRRLFLSISSTVLSEFP